MALAVKPFKYPMLSLATHSFVLHFDRAYVFVHLLLLLLVFAVFFQRWIMALCIRVARETYLLSFAEGILVPDRCSCMFIRLSVCLFLCVHPLNAQARQMRWQIPNNDPSGLSYAHAE